MVGLIQKPLCDLVASTAGTAAVSEVKRHAGVPEERQFRIDEAYDDEEWQRLLAATCEVLDITQEQAEQAYADFFCKDAQQRWPRWFQMSENGRQFLERAAHHP